eukprot:jgi/Mesvir1/2068/Mv02322-RA.1
MQRRAAAAAALLEAPGAPHHSVFVCAGDPIDVGAAGADDSTFLRGHGTHVVDGQLRATLCGVVERVNKLISVRPMKSRYNPENGDVIVGRVIEIQGKRWKLDINARQEAVLMLSAVNLPGGIQRRRTQVDELNMRHLYCERELLSAEVQALHHDGSVALHTRSRKYGKLTGGQLVKVPPSLIKRLKQHFHVLAHCQVQVILGCNGLVWISGVPPAVEGNAEDEVEEEGGDGADWTQKAAKPHVPVDLALRERICRVANSIRVLASLFLAIHPTSIEETYRWSEELQLSVTDMLGGDFSATILERELKRRRQNDDDMA